MHTTLSPSPSATFSPAVTSTALDGYPFAALEADRPAAIDWSLETADRHLVSRGNRTSYMAAALDSPLPFVGCEPDPLPIAVVAPVTAPVDDGRAVLAELVRRNAAANLRRAQNTTAQPALAFMASADACEPSLWSKVKALFVADGPTRPFLSKNCTLDQVGLPSKPAAQLAVAYTSIPATVLGVFLVALFLGTNAQEIPSFLVRLGAISGLV